MKKNVFIAFSISLLACGCQSVPSHKISDQPTSVKYAPVSQQQILLWQNGTLRETAPLPLSVIRFNSDRVTLSWDGDALELLRDLARARGQVFSYVGVRLPLPVDINVQGVTYENLLRIIEMQTAWRATLSTYPGQMVLQFMPAISERKGGRR